MRIAVLDSNHFEMATKGKKLFSELELIKTFDFIILFKCIDTKLNKKIIMKHVYNHYRTVLLFFSIPLLLGSY